MSESISCSGIADALLRDILEGKPPDLAAARLLATNRCSNALFRTVVEGLADRFERRFCDAYVEIFAEVLASSLPEYSPAQLRARYRRVRQPRPCTVAPERVFVLSRVTLGADIAVTSVLLQAAKQRFPNARITLAGGPKTAELWAADPRIEHAVVPYPRTGLLDHRLQASRALWDILDAPRSIVLDPDSRLTQLGVLPVSEESGYYFFESRAYGTGDEALPELAARWCGHVLGAGEARPYLALKPAPEPVRRRRATVSFGVGGNLAKRLGGCFEAGILRSLAGVFDSILIDTGAGGEEAERVYRALAESGVGADLWTGSFAAFAAHIAQSDLYLGYDSAGQHAAAALAIPLVTIFAGHTNRRMFERWKPTGAGTTHIVNAENLSPEEALEQCEKVLKTL